ncbi:Proline porter II [Raoultella terrigena]|uniref:Proline porter II n=1 Tax=Raoultella terrigena TaxID=577 RepID=A0A4V6J2R4_RAOTE|nr:Proline porter II [Raoultella terrigena]
MRFPKGLENPIFHWLHDYSTDFCFTPLAPGNGSLFTAHSPSRHPEIFTTIAKNWRIIAAGTLLVAMTTTTFYLLPSYPNLRKNVLHLSARDSLIVTMLVGISNFIWLPIGGAISDRIGRRPVLMGITILLCSPRGGNELAYRRAGFTRMTLVLLWFSFFFGMYNGAMVAALTEVMPVYVRTVGFSLAFSLATAIFGGLRRQSLPRWCR